MIVRKLNEVKNTSLFVEWGNGTSHRMLTEKDNMGFSVCYTTVNAGTESILLYDNHLEACLCIGGEGEIEDAHGNIHALKYGVLYALDKHDKHYLRASETCDLILVSIFNPSLQGHEKHDLKEFKASFY